MVSPSCFSESRTRRDWLKAGLAGCASLALQGWPRCWADGESAPPVDLTVDHVDTIPIKMEFREVPARNMARELPHWAYFEVIRLRLRSGHVGHGESMTFYTWGRSDAESLRRVQGRNAATLMWDDSLGSGVQTALFDAVGRALGVPVHALLGARVREKTALSWWDIDLPPDDLAAECREALAHGYTAFKTKGRPWFDVREQLRAISQVAPESFKFDIDFNDTLLEAPRAIPLLKELEVNPRFGIVETPIPQSDVAGNVAIHRAIHTPLAIHYGTPPPLVTLKEDVCDGFVVGGGASRVREQGDVAAMAHKPFWLQLVGTGITAAFSLHLAAVLDYARWPAVNCHQLFTHNLLTEPIRVENGESRIPNGPGLGVTIDEEALKRFRHETPRERPDPPRLIETTWPDGRRLYIANTGQVDFMLRWGREAKIPYFEAGSRVRIYADDGTPRWRALYESARTRPVMEVE